MAIENFCWKRKIKNRCDHYSRAETIQGRKLLIIWRFWPRKLFKGGNYSRAETIRGNTVISKNSFISIFSKSINKISTIYIHIVFEYIPSARLASATNLLTKFFINSFCSFHHLQKNAVSTWVNRLVGSKANSLKVA